MKINYKQISYFQTRPDVVKVFDDLDNYLDWCRFELRDFNPAHLYDRSNENYKAYLESQNRHRRWDKNSNRKYDRKHGQNFSR
jgi:hypothetical protein